VPEQQVRCLLDPLVGDSASWRRWDGGLPEDIADVVAFLASDDARWIIGHNFRANDVLI
jgi:NAD(P)-dependent dehydrogenase (short-subunit alcohol dehydrogenase family)